MSSELLEPLDKTKQSGVVLYAKREGMDVIGHHAVGKELEGRRIGSAFQVIHGL